MAKTKYTGNSISKNIQLRAKVEKRLKAHEKESGLIRKELRAMKSAIKSLARSLKKK